MLVLSGPSGAGKTTVARLVAAAISPSAHVQVDEVMAFVASGWIDPWLPEAAHQNEVVGVAAARAATALAAGGFTTIVDGHLVPSGAEGMATICGRDGVAVHYAILRADLATCAARAADRDPAGDRFSPVPDQLAPAHAQFADLGRYESHVVDASATPEDVSAAVLSAFRDGRLLLSGSI